MIGASHTRAIPSGPSPPPDRRGITPVLLKKPYIARIKSAATSIKILKSQLHRKKYPFSNRRLDMLTINETRHPQYKGLPAFPVVRR